MAGAGRSSLKITGRKDAGLSAAMRALDGAVVEVGILAEDAATLDGGIALGNLAAIHEFGAPSEGIPERAFLRPVFDAGVSRDGRTLETLAARVLSGKASARAALDGFGQTIRDRVIARIDGGISPPNAPATLKGKKGSSTPLVKTGRLRAHIKSKTTLGGAGNVPGGGAP